jgi:integrase
MSWVKGRTDLKPRTVDGYARLLELHILPTLGAKPLRDITPAVVRDWHGGLADTTGPTAQAQSYRLLRTVLNYALRDGEIAVNPCQIRNGGKPATQERDAPSLPQIHAVAAAVPARYQAMVLVAAYGGLRFGELTALQRQDVDLSAELPTVRVRQAMHRIRGRWVVGTPKTAAGTRTVALPAYLGPVLAAHLGKHVKDESPDALVFGTASGKPLSGANWGKAWRRVRESQGLSGCHFHDMRHAAATAAAQSGATLADTMRRFGHSSPRAALIYQHATESRSRELADRLDALVTAHREEANTAGNGDP